MNQDLGMLGNHYDVDDDDDYDGADGSAFREVEIREQDRFLPVANIARIMKKVLPNNAKIAKDAKESIQECVSEFISFITSEASDKCQQEKRKTINGDDILWAMTTLGFDRYVEPLKVYLAKYRESVKGEKPEKKPSASARAKENTGFASMSSPKSMLPMQSNNLSGTSIMQSHMGDNSGGIGLKYGGGESSSLYPILPSGAYAMGGMTSSGGVGHLSHPGHLPTSIPLQGMYQGGYHLPNSGGADGKTTIGIAMPPGTGYLPTSNNNNSTGMTQLSSASGMLKSPYPSIQPMYASPLIGNALNSLPLNMNSIPASSTPNQSLAPILPSTTQTPLSSSSSAIQYPTIAATAAASLSTSTSAVSTPVVAPPVGTHLHSSGSNPPSTVSQSTAQVSNPPPPSSSTIGGNPV